MRACANSYMSDLICVPAAKVWLCDYMSVTLWINVFMELFFFVFCCVVCVGVGVNVCTCMMTTDDLVSRSTGTISI